MSNQYAPEKTEEQIKSSPNNLFCISRSKNKNLVVYDAVLDASGNIDAKNCIKVYWMSIDPEYVKSKRQSKVMTDYEDLNFMEKSQAYGASGTEVKPGEFKLDLVAQPKMEVLLKLVDGRPRAITKIKGHECFMKGLYVDSTDNWLGFPSVNYVELTGIDSTTGETVVDRLKQ